MNSLLSPGNRNDFMKHGISPLLLISFFLPLECIFYDQYYFSKAKYIDIPIHDIISTVIDIFDLIEATSIIPSNASQEYVFK